MKTLNNFLASDQEVHVLSNLELISVRGGDNPPAEPIIPIYPPVKKLFFHLALNMDRYFSNFR